MFCDDDLGDIGCLRSDQTLLERRRVAKAC